MSAEQEIAAGERFGFGANWRSFLTLLDDRRIAEAERSLRTMLGVQDLKGRRFLDIGCGSGLFSLAARRLGATVHSFDFDPQSVGCARELKLRFYPDDPSWRIEEGSVLDRAYMERLGQFDIVYSWGVLHHTGAMWLAIEHAVGRVAEPDGCLFIAIYNDQGWKSHLWWLIKAFYNRLPRLLRKPFIFLFSTVINVLVIIRETLKLQPMEAIRPLLSRSRERGMNASHDMADWIGGFPFEFASTPTLLSYFAARGFAPINERSTTSWGCNELAMRRVR
jgi:2-polyprenyl-6-hydroxyphenyl methylase/3-demethylubiquinone-9 3-methyltransferase